MDADFINAYVDQLNKKLHDLTSETIVLKTKLAVTERLAASLQSDLSEARITIDSLKAKKPKTNPSDGF